MEAKKQGREYRKESSDVSGNARAGSNDRVRKDALSLYGEPRRRKESAPQGHAHYGTGKFAENIEKFISKVRKYIDLDKLPPSY